MTIKKTREINVNGVKMFFDFHKVYEAIQTALETLNPIAIRTGEEEFGVGYSGLVAHVDILGFRYVVSVYNCLESEMRQTNTPDLNTKGYAIEIFNEKYDFLESGDIVENLENLKQEVLKAIANVENYIPI